MRAIAVLSVVIYHAFPNWLRGGFIGVDIFFVISGFLISTIIISNLERNTFSFIEFYSRRIKRIFPALILVLISSFVFGWFTLLADEYKQLGKHMAGGAGFISNFLFWNESGYFDNSANTKPLLHLWSLGIEEQFYIVWPLLLWLAWKKQFNLLTIATIVAIISFTLNLNKVHSDAVTAFYSPQTRFWELLIGSVLAYLTLHGRSLFPKLKHQLDSWLGKMIYA
ncbi:MAG: acyltransferase [Methylophilaceae bacterium]